MSFAALRDLVYQEPSADVWTRMLGLVAEMDVRNEAVAVDYIGGYIQAWPDDLRVLKHGHLSASIEEPPRLRRLAKVLCLDGARLAAGELERLLGASWFDGISGLDLSRNPLGHEGARVLADSGRLSQLRWLTLDRCHLEDEGLEALAACPDLESVERLGLSANKGRVKGCRALLSSPYLSGLSSLDLSRNNVGAEGARAMAQNPALSSVRVLKLKTAGLGPAGLSALARSPLLGGLEELSLEVNQLPRQCAGVLSDATFAPRLEKLFLTGNPELGRDLGDLARADLGRLRRLEIGGCEVSSNALGGLLRAPWMDEVERLSLGLKPDERQACLLLLGAAARMKGLRVLEVDGPLGPAELMGILGSGALPALERLRVGPVSITRDAMGVTLADVPKLCLLDVLRIEATERDAAAVGPILAETDLSGVEAVEVFPYVPESALVGLLKNTSAASLRCLDASNTLLVADAAAKALAGAPHVSNLERLEIQGGGLTDAGAEAIAGAGHLHEVEVLTLSGEGLGEEGARALASAPFSRILRFDYSGPGVGYAVWEIFLGSALARPFLAQQTLRRSTEALNRSLDGLLGFARRRGVEGAGLKKEDLVEKIVTAAAGRS